MATITTLNSSAGDFAAENLVLAGELPLVRKTLDVINPTSVAITRGMAIIRSCTVEEASDGNSGTVDVLTPTDDLYVAGSKSGGSTIPGDIVAIVAEDMALDGVSTSIPVSCYVFGAFNVAEVTTLNSLDITTDLYVLGAQGNGIYLM